MTAFVHKLPTVKCETPYGMPVLRKLLNKKLLCKYSNGFVAIVADDGEVSKRYPLKIRWSVDDHRIHIDVAPDAELAIKVKKSGRNARVTLFSSKTGKEVLMWWAVDQGYVSAGNTVVIKPR